MNMPTLPVLLPPDDLERFAVLRSAGCLAESPDGQRLIKTLVADLENMTAHAIAAGQAEVGKYQGASMKLAGIIDLLRTSASNADLLSDSIGHRASQEGQPSD